MQGLQLNFLKKGVLNLLNKNKQDLPLPYIKFLLKLNIIYKIKQFSPLFI